MQQHKAAAAINSRMLRAQVLEEMVNQHPLPGLIIQYRSLSKRHSEGESLVEEIKKQAASRQASHLIPCL